jgi:TatD DNase family protein
MIKKGKKQILSTAIFLSTAQKYKKSECIDYLWLLKHMKLINSHTHKTPDNRNITVQNIRINNDAMSLAHGPDIFFSAGIHPWDSNEFELLWLDKLTMLLNYQQVVAVGECGFDKTTGIPYEVQKEVFEKQIIASETMRKPVIIHCVGYFNELIQLRNEHQPQQAWIIHGFRGKPQMAEQLVRAGFYLSYGEKYNPESVAATPVNRILTETDESDIQLAELYTAICKLKNCEIDDLNAAALLFSLKKL